MPLGNVPKDNVKTILVCGLSGAGKTSFINTATGSKLVVGHGTDSATSEIMEEGIPLVLLNGVCFQLVDVPGFDNTHGPSDAEIFLKLAAWLAERYQADRKVTGLIYLRSIDTPRVNKLEASFIGMFKALCGERQLGHITLVTNRWSSPADEGSEERERKLASDVNYFGTSAGKSVQTRRLINHYTKKDALQILAAFQNLSPATLTIQHETIIENKVPLETMAGTRLNDYVNEAIARLMQDRDKANERAYLAREGVKTAKRKQKKAKYTANSARLAAIQGTELRRKRKHYVRRTRRKWRGFRGLAARLIVVFVGVVVVNLPSVAVMINILGGARSTK